MMSFEIARSRPRELPQLFALAESAFAAMPGWNGPRVAQALEQDVVFVAHEAGAVAGFLALRERAHSLLIEQILVAPGHERHGVGRGLVAYAEGYAVLRRMPILEVVVEEGNERARDLYRRMGFEPREREIFARSLPYVL